MVQENGRLFHIDFGHFLGNFKKFKGVERERSSFVFTHAMAAIMGGTKSELYAVFKDKCCTAYNILRRHAPTLTALFRLMIPAGIPELTCE